MEFHIPTDIAWYVLSRKQTKPFALYLFLKYQCSGMIRLNDDLVKKAKVLLKYAAEKSIKNNLQKLLKLNFIGFNQKTGIYYMRGWNTIQNNIGTQQRTAAIFEEEDFSRLQVFLFAAIIQKQLRRKRYQAAQLRASAFQPDTGFPPFSFSVRYIAKILHISICLCHALKNAAKKSGYIEVNESWKPTRFEAVYLNKMIRHEPDQWYKIRQGKIHIRQPDLIKSNVVIVKRKYGKKKNNSKEHPICY
jgi:hypothetical protein